FGNSLEDIVAGLERGGGVGFFIDNGLDLTEGAAERFRERVLGHGIVHWSYGEYDM
ncbi:MAG: hypothetical protein Q9174_007127, partial [Haloplaca sp. 1 TL-2023]